MRSARLHFRQGDVLLIQIHALPADAREVPVSGERVVLAHGEVTGHAHVVANRMTKYFEHHDGRSFLALDEDSALTHEEHTAVFLPAGTYEVRRQREYSPGSQSWQQVVD